jgi:hypothetical protein
VRSPLAGLLLFSTLLFSMLVFPARAGDILSSDVTLEAGQYAVTIEAAINAPLNVVYRSITDYNNLATINPSIEESRVLLVMSPDRHRVRSVIKVCILVFCKRVVQVQDVTRVDARTVDAVTLPGDSDFRYGVARWQLTPAGEATRLHFTQEFIPDFWVPPIIGTWLIQRKLLQEVTETAMYIEVRDEASNE